SRWAAICSNRSASGRRSSWRVSAAIDAASPRPRASRMPSSSNASRAAAVAYARISASWSPRACASSRASGHASRSSSAPPGNTWAPGPKLAVGERRVSNTSGPADVSRNSRIVAAARGVTPSLHGWSRFSGRTEVVKPGALAKESGRAAVASGAGGEACRARSRLAVLQRVHAQRELVGERFVDREAELLVGGAAVVAQAGLRQRGELVGQGDRRGTRRAVGHDPVGQADALGLARVDRAPGQDQVQRPRQADEARQAYR